MQQVNYRTLQNENQNVYRIRALAEHKYRFRYMMCMMICITGSVNVIFILANIWAPIDQELMLAVFCMCCGIVLGGITSIIVYSLAKRGLQEYII